MARKSDPRQITSTPTVSVAIPTSVTKANVASIELIATMNATTGEEFAEKVLVINPR